MRWLCFIIVTTTAFWSAPSMAESCACETIACNRCEHQVDLNFYTAKCEGSRVKSCSKPVCAAVYPAPEGCGGNSSTQASSSTKKANSPAQREKHSEKNPVGTVLMSMGDVRVVREKQTASLKINQKMFNGDEVLAGDNGKAKIMFTDESNMTLLPKTRTKIQHEIATSEKQATTVVSLLFGTVRSVVTKSEGGQKKYRVETPSAVAGVRGTDFLTTYYENSQITKVQTLEGKVELASLTGGTKSLIPAGQYASFVIDTDHDTSSASMKYVDNGFITPLGSINSEQLKEIDRKFAFDSGREMASNSPEDSPICAAPAAYLNQCSYQCINNPKKAEHCRTDLSSVKCLRKRCNANGVWAEETRLPASHYEKCPPAGIVVERCDY